MPIPSLSTVLAADVSEGYAERIQLGNKDADEKSSSMIHESNSVMVWMPIIAVLAIWGMLNSK